MLGTHFDHVPKEQHRYYNVPENYTPWLGQYIRDRFLPKFKNKIDLYKFLLGSMYIGLPHFCATNREVLDEIGKEMYILNISYLIEPYNNCECRYTMWIDKSVFDVLEETINAF